MLLQYETKLISDKIKYIAGVDEVGRGALAGPMVVGAVILDSTHLNQLINIIRDAVLSATQNPESASSTNNDVLSQEFINNYGEINDSKKLSAKKRTHLSQFIQSICISYSLEIIDNTTIDNTGISRCTQMGFYNAISKLKVKPHHILTDTFNIKAIPSNIQTNIIKGDSKSITIAAASIVAKVFRDNLMEQLATSKTEYVPYMFAKNKAYGTKEHLEALYKYGPCDLHRKSYEPIKSMLARA